MKYRQAKLTVIESIQLSIKKQINPTFRSIYKFLINSKLSLKGKKKIVL
jgi:hypothetical protein